MRIRMIRAQRNRSRAAGHIHDARNMRGQRQHRREVMHGNRRANRIRREARYKLFGECLAVGYVGACRGVCACYTGVVDEGVETGSVSDVRGV